MQVIENVPQASILIRIKIGQEIVEFNILEAMGYHICPPFSVRANNLIADEHENC
jgi:hypothetical protein